MMRFIDGTIKQQNIRSLRQLQVKNSIKISYKSEVDCVTQNELLVTSQKIKKTKKDYLKLMNVTRVCKNDYKVITL